MTIKFKSIYGHSLIELSGYHRMFLCFIWSSHLKWHQSMQTQCTPQRNANGQTAMVTFSVASSWRFNCTASRTVSFVCTHALFSLSLSFFALSLLSNLHVPVFMFWFVLFFFHLFILLFTCYCMFQFKLIFIAHRFDGLHPWDSSEFSLDLFHFVVVGCRTDRYWLFTQLTIQITTKNSILLRIHNFEHICLNFANWWCVMRRNSWFTTGCWTKFLFSSLILLCCFQFVRRCKCVCECIWITLTDPNRTICVYSTSVAHLLNVFGAVQTREHFQAVTVCCWDWFFVYCVSFTHIHNFARCYWCWWCCCYCYYYYHHYKHYSCSHSIAMEKCSPMAHWIALDIRE